MGGAPIKSGKWQDYWSEIRTKRAEEMAAGKVTLHCFKSSHGSYKLHVVCPFNEAWRCGAKELSGRWKPESMAWVFPWPGRRLVYGLACEVFGSGMVRAAGWDPKN